MVTKTRAALHRGNDNSANVHSVRDTQIIASDVLLAVAGVALIVGVPFIMALLKQFGWW